MNCHDDSARRVGARCRPPRIDFRKQALIFGAPEPLRHLDNEPTHFENPGWPSSRVCHFALRARVLYSQRRGRATTSMANAHGILPRAATRRHRARRLRDHGELEA